MTKFNKQTIFKHGETKMKLSIKYLSIMTVLGIAYSAQAQTIAGSTLDASGNTLSATNGQLVLQGEKADGSTTKWITLDGNGFLNSTGGAQFAESIGTNQNLFATGTITSNGSITTGGNITATGGVSGINISTTGGKVNINGVNGNILTQGVFNANGKATIDGANGNISTLGSVNVNGKVNINGSNGNVLTQGVFNANGKAFVDGTNGDITATGMTMANGGLTVGNGATISGGLNVQNSKITNVANGTNDQDAVNVRQLNAEATARINGDVNTLNQANTYTNTQVANAVGQANNYTDSRVNAETQRAMQAERELGNHINAVGAMAMAVGSMPRTMYNPDRKSRLNLGIGNYGNASAMAVGLSHDFNDRISGNLNVAQSITGNGNSGVGAGLSIGF